MLPTVLAGERGWFPCDRCRTHAVSSNKQDVDPFRQRREKEKKKESRKRKTKHPTIRELSNNMQNHKKKRDSEHQSRGKSKEQMAALNE